MTVWAVGQVTYKIKLILVGAHKNNVVYNDTSVDKMTTTRHSYPYTVIIKKKKKKKKGRKEGRRRKRKERTKQTKHPQPPNSLELQIIPWEEMGLDLDSP